MKASIRQQVHEKCNGRCGYCGTHIELKQMQVDHIQAKWHTVSEEDAKRDGIIKGSDDFENLMPSCRRCNKWKATFTIEQFRNEIQLQTQRLIRDSAGFRIAKDFGIIQTESKPVIFYFELNDN